MLKKRFSSKLLMLLSITALLIQGCGRLSVKDDLKGEKFSLVNQDSTQVTFPEAYSGKVLLVGYIYTHCPDICPLITYNMRDVQKKIDDQQNFMLVSISFDPARDTPGVLAQYADNYELNLKNWELLTGESSEVESTLEKLQVTRVKSPTQFTENNTPIYFIDHSDKVSLIDKKGRLRKSYFGSELHSEDVAEDIRTLLNER